MKYEPMLYSFGVDIRNTPLKQKNEKKTNIEWDYLGWRLEALIICVCVRVLNRGQRYFKRRNTHTHSFSLIVNLQSFNFHGVRSLKRRSTHVILMRHPEKSCIRKTQTHT